ncbi:hypothetical protein B0T10DRAFT_467437 [Thelonectria olida]|uniref:G domain-containing protein n=1 Tax=Thelonectria olida TaxID=1576542 RepID=A0A9P9AE81_9HYPO|nr:hypothetical protein B0T10DRAFT_467437 [Thelonectria olida]
MLIEKDTNGVEFHSMDLKGKLVHLVDTPGFDDTWRSDFEVLSEITFILAQIYRQGMKLAGILYLHRISDNRVSGSALKNFNLLGCICGFDAAPRIFFITTMWELEGKDYDEGLLRESRLVTTREFWGRFCRNGSQTKRWRGDESSALSIIHSLITLSESEGYTSLLIQREIVDNKKTLKETMAGQELLSEYVLAESKLSDQLQSLQSKTTYTTGPPPDIEGSLAELRKEIKDMKYAKSKLEVSIKDLFVERESAYAAVLSQMCDDQQKLAAEVEEGRRKYQRLQEEMKSNEELLREERHHWEMKRAKLDEAARAGWRRRESLDTAYQEIDDEETLLNEQLGEFQDENEENMSQTSQNLQKLRKRDVMKRNLFPILGVLAGVGLAVAGGVTGIFP